jgi:prophage tail gpP-like protein
MAVVLLDPLPPESTASPKPAPPPESEIAVIVCNGMEFGDWETVMVQHTWGEPSAKFEFSAAEREDPVPTLWSKLKIKPGDIVNITLAGQVAITSGIVVTRQVAYDANQHAIQLQGYSQPWVAARSSVDVPQGNFDGQSFLQIAQKCLAKHPVGIKVIGSIDQTPFQNCQNEKGETNWEFLERIARPRGIVLAGDHLNNFLIIGEHAYPVSSSVIESVNILKCQCVISIENLYASYGVSSQAPASDSQNGTAASEQEKHVSGSGPGNYLSPSTFPVHDLSEVLKAANNEARWAEGTLVQATITVQGWLRPGTGDLWRVGDNVHVYSPMAILDQTLKIKTVTYTQDNSASGTLAELHLVDPRWLGDQAYGLSVPTNMPPASREVEF